MKEVLVTTGEHSYRAVIGESSIHRVNEAVEKLNPDRVALVISSHVYSLHREYVENAFTALHNRSIIIMDDSEKNKNYRYAEDFLEQFIENSLSRKSLVIAVGGGVVGDFAGYLAALYMRGIPVIQVPTTILAMVDSSIGGKVAVNLSQGKNMVGAFHQPVMVAADTKFLSTLPEEEIKNGLSEVLKHGLLGDRETIEILENNSLKSILDGDIISRIVERSVAFKASVVSGDAREGGRRAILNFGHTIAHSVESLMNYSGISHGKAVAAGIIAAMNISRKLGWLELSDIKIAENIIDKYQLYGRDYKLDTDLLISHMKFDKKNYGERINFVLLKGMFRPEYNVQVEEPVLREVLTEIFS